MSVRVHACVGVHYQKLCVSSMLFQVSVHPTATTTNQQALEGGLAAH